MAMVRNQNHKKYLLFENTSNRFQLWRLKNKQAIWEKGVLPIIEHKEMDEKVEAYRKVRKVTFHTMML